MTERRIRDNRREAGLRRIELWLPASVIADLDIVASVAGIHRRAWAEDSITRAIARAREGQNNERET